MKGKTNASEKKQDPKDGKRIISKPITISAGSNMYQPMV